MSEFHFLKHCRFPEWVEEENLQAFRGATKSSCKVLTGYIIRALKWEEEKGTESLEMESANEIKMKVSNGKYTSIVLASIDVQKINNIELMVEAPSFNGSGLIFLDFPKVNI